jgi:hypothetical protein
LDIGGFRGGPLFFAHYSFLGFDPRDKRDAYTDYFKHNTNHTLINRAYAIQNPKNFKASETLSPVIFLVIFITLIGLDFIDLCDAIASCCVILN